MKGAQKNELKMMFVSKLSPTIFCFILLFKTLLLSIILARQLHSLTCCLCRKNPQRAAITSLLCHRSLRTVPNPKDRSSCLKTGKSNISAGVQGPEGQGGQKCGCAQGKQHPFPFGKLYFQLFCLMFQIVLTLQSAVKRNSKIN